MSGRRPHTPRDRHAHPARTGATRNRVAESDHPLRIHTFLTGSGLLVVSLAGAWLIALL